MAAGARWGRDFDPDELARLETRMWKAYYRRQPLRLFAMLIQALREQARVSWPRALWASLLLTRAAAGFARSTGGYERFAPDIGRGYRALGLPDNVDVEAVARHELRWWVVRREIGLAAGQAAGEAITDLYAALYDVPRDQVAEAGRLRGLAAEVRDRGATDDLEGPTAAGSAYWPVVARLLRDSYRSLKSALDTDRERPHGGSGQRAGEHVSERTEAATRPLGRETGATTPSGRRGDGPPATTPEGRSQRRRLASRRPRPGMG